LARKLKDIEIEEISLCDAASNRKTFYILKRRKEMDNELKELFEDWFDEEELTEVNDELEILKGDDKEKIEKIKDATIKALKGAVNILNKYKADLPDDALKALKTLAKYASYGYGYPEKKEASDEVKKAIAVASLSKSTIEKIEKIIDELKDLINKGVKKSKSEDGEISDEIQAKLEKLAELEEKEKKAIEKAKEEAEKKEKEEREELLKRIERLEKTKGIKKSIEGQEGNDADDGDEEDKWPSIPVVT